MLVYVLILMCPRFAGPSEIKINVFHSRKSCERIMDTYKNCSKTCVPEKVYGSNGK